MGLSKTNLGTVTFGRQYDSVVDFVQPVTAVGQFGGPFVRGGDIDNTDNSFRVDNSVKYASPSLGGFTFSNYQVWGQYKVTPATTLGAAYAYTDGKVDYNGTKPKYHQVSLMGSYAVSKRTSFYAMAGVQQAAGDAKQADIFDFSIGDASTTKRQAMVRLGMLHQF